MEHYLRRLIMSYREPLATTTGPGIVTVGAGLAITPQGVLSATGAGGTVGFSVNAATPQITDSTDGTITVDSMTLVPGAGTYQVAFNANYSINPIPNDITAQAAIDVVALAAALNALPSTGPHGAVFGLGETITPGVYDVPSAAAIQGILTLDALGDPTAIFVFRMVGALTSVAASQVLLVNGANAANVFWIANGGAVALGAATVFEGTALSVGGAAGLGAGSTMVGRLLSTTGAITTDTDTVSVPIGSSVVPLGVLNTFALFTAIGNVTNTGTSIINGDIGTNTGAITGYGIPTVVNGNIYLPGSQGLGPVVVNFAVFANGVLVPNSTRRIEYPTEVFDSVVSLQAVATVLAGQAIDIVSLVEFGTLTVNNRILSLIQV
jgi:hypothetical protein